MISGKPVTPDEIPALKVKLIPSYVIDAVNALLALKANGMAPITLTQEEVIVEALKRAPGKENRGTLFASHALEFEDVYRAAGWEVSYDKPGYNESYPASFEFKPKGKA